MGKRAAQKPAVFTNLKLKQTSARGALLTTKAGLLEVTVITPDLLRLRATKAKQFNTGSFAVVKNDWPSVNAQVHERKNFLELSHENFSFRLDTTKGTWSLTDRNGWRVVNSTTAIEHQPDRGFTLRLGLGAKDKILGLGESTGPLNKRGLIREFWNIDVLGHASCIHPSLKNLYVSIPFGLCQHEGRTFGVFWDNPGKQVWDMGCTQDQSWQMSAATGELDVYLFLGPGLPQIVQSFTELTGRITLPPKWALGYQQSRYGYPTRKQIEDVALKFRQKKIPCDVLHLDILHMDEYRVFTFGKTFPRPKELIRKLGKQGFQCVSIVDPGVKVDAKFGVYQRGHKRRAFVQDAAGKDIIGKVWPGPSGLPDFFQADVRAWWATEQAALTDRGIAGVWSDMNEPATFDLPGKTLPLDAQHVTELGVKTHSEVHNAYGSMMARASHEGLLANAPEQRPFVITRAGYAGVQRYAMVWTGDNSSTWEHLAESIPMLLNLSLSGVPFCGADAGGFLEHTTGELLARWTQLAAFTPFFRNHTNNESRDQEPWTFGPEVEDICRRYIQLRYQFLPYLYCLFAEARAHGTPIMRPLAWHYPQDPVAGACGDQFLLGENVLVAPILQPGVTARSVYLPAGTWFNFWNGEAHEGGQHILAHAPLDTLPLYVRAGTILPFGPVQQFVGEVSEPFQLLHIWPGGNGTLDWHEDDGISNGYLNGQYQRRRIETKQVGETTELIIGASAGEFQSPYQAWRIMLHQQAKRPTVQINGRRYKMHHEADWGLGIIDLPVVAQEIRMRVG